ncbi:uncharacterized protein L969DRAFT_50718 [Mixia osmundae IAM 14324]|uniref:Uncharacterized protein n=1 Tax=Mixia osmundae (strain CBS 9802 / IAM 14324 / JCM 22182 / KY 12970) TaxID=764103 RepID=G7E7P6_MIXOS|nr:uncharacterized protein L969DRAFT_50718 [Mixia osmundae IAM 14324]KEI38456.1 hypothetical protein L969DRAFT_50718 [Mixia osmundae IAM 14324]GAA98856.1 hypothetical protein E5Q_05544 [Mixia osmundae IAM 14324]
MGGHWLGFGSSDSIAIDQNGLPRTLASDVVALRRHWTLFLSRSLGLSTANGQSQWPATPYNTSRALSQHTTALVWLVFVAVLLLLCYLGNPKDVSFRIYLTDLSFKTHLHRLRTQSVSSKGSPHTLAFTKRMMISLKTPEYTLRNYHLFSTVTLHHDALSTGAEATLTQDKPAQTSQAAFADEAGSTTGFNLAQRQAVFFGALGHWWALDEHVHHEAEAIKLATSIAAMETDATPKLIRDTKGQRAAKQAQKREEAARQKAAAAEAAAKARRTAPAHPRHDDRARTSSRTVSAAHTELLTQLEQVKETSRATQHQLQADLEELRNQKREDDLARVTLKARTRAAEDARRASEQGHLQTERKLTMTRNAKRTAQDHTARLRSELGRLEKRKSEALAKIDTQAARARTDLAKVRSDVARKTSEVKDAEASMAAARNRVQASEASLENLKTRLALKQSALISRYYEQVTPSGLTAAHRFYETPNEQAYLPALPQPRQESTNYSPLVDSALSALGGSSHSPWADASAIAGSKPLLPPSSLHLHSASRSHLPHGIFDDDQSAVGQRQHATIWNEPSAAQEINRTSVRSRPFDPWEEDALLARH